MVSSPSSPSQCRMCGATSYRRVISRGEDGVMRASGLYQCSGCSVVFADPKAWRGAGDDEAPTRPPKPDSREATHVAPAPPSAPNFATYGLAPPGSAGAR